MYNSEDIIDITRLSFRLAITYVNKFFDIYVKNERVQLVGSRKGVYYGGKNNSFNL